MAKVVLVLILICVKVGGGWMRLSFCIILIERGAGIGGGMGMECVERGGGFLVMQFIQCVILLGTGF